MIHRKHGSKLWLAGGALAFALFAGGLTSIADAHPPIGVRVAARSARVAARGAYVAARAPVVATRATYRATAYPLYRHPYYYRHVARPVVVYPRVVPSYHYVRPVVRYGYHY